MMRRMPSTNVTKKVNDYRKLMEDAEKRRARALQLRAEGKTVQQIGDELKVSKQRASQILKAAGSST